MKKHALHFLSKDFILMTVLLLTGILLLAGVFIEASIISPSLQINQLVYYNMYIPFFALCIFLSVLVNSKKYPLDQLFCKMESLIFIFAIVIALTYQWQLNPAPERLFFLFQICGLWYLLRIATYHYPILSVAWSVVLMIFGGIQSFIGIMQLYGWASSNHSLFSMTGSFFNPGPYSGFLALTLPIAIYFILRYKHYKRISIFYKSVYWISWICAAFIFIALPSTMGRTAWVAAIVATLWVVCRERWWWFKSFFRQHKVSSIISGALLVVAAVLLLSTSYSIKKNSADGRLFLWKMEISAWTNNLMGTGIGGFQRAYGVAQSDYFADGCYTEQEELVAGTPAYAFNEYLQLLIEHSFLGGVILLWIGRKVFHCGYWNRQTGWLGVLISLAVFAFASYPFQLPIFVIILMFAATGCMSWKRREEFYTENYPHSNKVKTIVLVFLLALVECLIACRQWNIEKPYCEWEKNRMFYQIKAYEKVVDSYQLLLPALKSQPDFLFEYAHSLAKIGEHNTSNRILEQGAIISSDPMFWNVMGKNYQAMGVYSSAEECYLEAMHILPSRIYPYYLLTKLYAEPDINRKDCILQFGRIVLEKEPKIQSTAVKQMRNEIRQLIEKY